MDAWLNQLTMDAFGRLALDQVLAGALAQFYAFTLVLIRMSGLMIVGPVFGQSAVPINIRVFLTIALSLLLTPLLASRHGLGFDRLDLDQNGLLAMDEIPPGLRPRIDQMLRQVGHTEEDELSRAEYRLSVVAPNSPWEYARIAAGELVLGLLLGTGVMAVLSGLQIAGQLIDQQSGLGLGQIFNPELGESLSLTGQTLHWLGGTVFLLLSPLGGHLQMVQILVETFETMPVGEAVLTSTTGDLLNDLIKMSLLLGLRVAAPVMVMMSLIDLTFGFLSHSVPQINIQAVGYALRGLLGLLILSVTLTNVGELAIAPLTEGLELLRDSLVYPR